METVITQLDLGAGYILKEASFFDVPFIFNLMMDGSQLGAFSDTYLSGTGALQLFLTIFIGVLLRRDWPPRSGLRAAWLVISRTDKEFGFMKIVALEPEGGRANKYISLYAIDSALRGQGHGRAVLQRFVNTLEDGSNVVVNCTKYARRMQHILKAVGFTRNPKSGRPLEEYRLVVRKEARSATSVRRHPT